jgi:methyl-accepting chemotaxis protein
MTQAPQQVDQRTRRGTIPRVPDSIFVKCVIALALATSLIVGVVTIKSILVANRIGQITVQDLGAQITDLVGEQTAAAIRFGKSEDIEARLASTLEGLDGKASGAMVTDLLGQALAVLSDTEAATALMMDAAREALSTGESLMNAERLIFAQPVIYPGTGDIVGVVVFDWSTDAMYSVVRAEQVNTVIIAVVVGVALIVFVGLLLKRTVSRPLLRVADAMKAVAAGNYDIEIPKLRRGNEIGAVARALEEFRDQLQSSEATRRDAAFKGAAVDAGSAPLLLADADGTIVYASPAILTLLRDNLDALQGRLPDFDLDALVGSNIDQFHAAPSRNRAMLDDMSNEPHVTDLEFGAFTVKLSVSAIDRDGQRIGYVTEWAEVTQTRLNEAILSSFNANQTRADFDAQGRLVDLNPAFSTAFGISPDADSTQFDHMVHTAAGDAVDPGKCHFGDFRITGPDGRTGIVHGGLSPVKNRAGQLVRCILIGVDVTRERAASTEAEQERERILDQQSKMITSLRTALAALSNGDLTARIAAEFAPEHEELRNDFNTATEKLEAALARVVENADTIHGEAAQVTSAADDLSRRTERQAATLEETAAAVAELTASVQSSAEGAKEAAQVVSDAHDNAHTSGGVVRDAVTAMSEIESSSDKISKIISLIDDIAFQTNLLALNAGVEAARAGDAGRGFAVVASEVRVLAQRSSDAASEINDLISTSGQHVKRGVKLVGEAGSALEKIVESVGSIAEHVSAIAASAQEQSTGLEEINNAMGQLDQVTQKNAAMFEETTAASHALNREAASLKSVVETFTTRVSSAAHLTQAAAPPAFRSERGERTSEPPVPPVSPATRGALALKPDAEDDDWQDF